MTDAHDHQLARMRRAADALPATTREVFRLHAAQRLPYLLIAARLGITLAEVEQHLADALFHLMQTLGPLEERD